MNDLKADIINLYFKSGVKDEGFLWIFTEGHIADERFLISINDLLASGEIAGLYNQEDLDAIVGAIRGKVKAAGGD